MLIAIYGALCIFVGGVAVSGVAPLWLCSLLGLLAGMAAIRLDRKIKREASS